MTAQSLCTEHFSRDGGGGGHRNPAQAGERVTLDNSLCLSESNFLVYNNGINEIHWLIENYKRKERRLAK